MSEDRAKGRRPPLGVVTGVIGLIISVVGYVNEVSGVALRSVLAAAAGTAATTVVGGMVAVGLTVRARRRWWNASRSRGRRALLNVSEKPAWLAGDPKLLDSMYELFHAAVGDVVERAGVGRDEIAASLIIGNPDLSRAGEPASEVLSWREGQWPLGLTPARLAEAAWPAVTAGTPQFVEASVDDGAEPLLVVPLVGDAKGPSLGAFVFLGLIEHAPEHRTKQAVSTLLNWAKLATITLGGEQVARLEPSKSNEVPREASA